MTVFYYSVMPHSSKCHPALDAGSLQLIRQRYRLGGRYDIIMSGRYDIIMSGRYDTTFSLNIKFFALKSNK